jgi:hypothetical protein
METFLTFILPIFGAIGGAFAIFQRSLAIKEQMKKDYIDNFISIRSEIGKNRKNIYKFRTESGIINNKYFKQDLPLLSLNNSILNEPIDLDNITLKFSDDIEPSLGKYRIKFGLYDEYSNAIEKKDKPNSFFPGLQYRLLEINNNTLVFSNKKYTYFDKINYGASLSYEAAKDYKKNKTPLNSKYRKIVGKLDSPSDYVILTGISTLTLLVSKNNETRIIMHKRGKDKTAYAFGTYHVIPAGEFQPACVSPKSWTDDFSIVRNIMREFSEEIADNDEYNGESGVPFNYNQEPFISIMNAKNEGRMKLFYLGTGFDAVSLQGEIMTCAVFDEETFFNIFPNIITENKEGIIITDKDRWGRPSEDDLDSYFDSNTLATGETILKIVKEKLHFFRDCMIQK